MQDADALDYPADELELGEYTELVELMELRAWAMKYASKELMADRTFVVRVVRRWG